MLTRHLQWFIPVSTVQSKIVGLAFWGHIEGHLPVRQGGNTMPLDTVQHDHSDTVVAARWAEQLPGDETGEVFDVPKVGFDLKVRQCPMDIRVKAQCRQGVLQPDENSPHCPGSGVPVARSSGIVRDSLV